MKSETSKIFSLIIIAIAFVALLYGTAKAIQISNKTQISTRDGIYTNRVKTSQDIIDKAFELTESCPNQRCQIQNLLDYVTQIPYKINHFKAHSPQKTIQNNFGDCDDKSNLLISMLHALGKEAYFVLVPKHIFVIIPIDDKNLEERKGLWIDGKKYFILESTAKGSVVGFPLHYQLDEINVLVDPFSNEKLTYKQLAWK
jgi:hypothetical protein